MPIYEYSCRRCQNRFEELVRSSSEAVTCPECQSPEIKREMSVFSSRGGNGARATDGGGCGCTPSSCGCR